MNFFSLVKQIKPLLDIYTKEDTATRGSGTLLSKVVSPKIYAPALSIIIPTIAESIPNLSIPEFISKGFDKLSELVDSLTGTKSKPTSIDKVATVPNKTTSSLPTNLDIKAGIGKQSGLRRMTSSELGLSGQIPDRGSYTSEEADTIISLRSSGADTSGSKTKIHPKIEELIRSKAAEYGVDQDIAVKIAIVESGGNPNAISSTGAIGVFQFTGATANLMGLANRFNTADNIDAGIRLLVADKRFVGSFNSDVATYLALQIGGPNAKYVLTSDRSTKISELPSKVQNAVRGNLGGKSATVGGYIDANAAALEEKIKAQQSKPVYAAVTEPSTVVMSTPKASPSTVASSISKPSELPSKKVEPLAASNNKTVASKPVTSPSPSSYIATTPSTAVVKETKPTTVEPNYTKPSPPQPTTTKVATAPSPNSSTKDKQSSPTLDGVVRHKSGMYFNAA